MAPSVEKYNTEHPLEPPPFTIKQLQQAIPAHCFKRSIPKSFSYIFMDLVMLAGLAYSATYISLTPTWMAVILWMVYGFVAGLVSTGLWVIGHECGHQSFSESKRLNNFVGLIIHSALLVPYHSWRISHSMHHKATSHMDKDQVFVPSTKSDFNEALSSSPLTSLVGIVVMLTLGWPGYLIANLAGQKYSRRTNHFEPTSPIFKTNQKGFIITSDLSLVAVFFILGGLIQTFGFSTVFLFYGLPYLWTNFWLVLITYLHHTNKNLPHYRGKEWTFVRGALCTIDRDYGIFLNFFHHNIGDTHICHHLFSTIPHYHAKEATEAMKPILGKFYKKTNQAILPSVYEAWTSCHFVEDSGDVLFYQSTNKTKNN